MLPRSVMPRRLQRYLLEVSIIAVVILVLVGLDIVRIAPSYRRDSNDADSDFYYFFELPSYKAGHVEQTAIRDGRRRTLNTSAGLVEVKDLMLIPENPLPKGANLYRSFPDGTTKTKMKSRLGLSLDDTNSVDHNRNISCVSKPCIEYLSDFDIQYYQYCGKKANIMEDKPPAATCSFRKSDSALPLVALASSSESGIDNLRWFLQELTGLCTGSVDCNVNLRRAGYAGENLWKSTAVLGVKITWVNPLWSGMNPGIPDMPAFDSAIYLLRNPFDAILEDWNQKQSKSGMRWEDFVSKQAVIWQQMLQSWLINNNNHSIIVVRYEKLEEKTTTELLKILKFLTVPYSVTKLTKVKWIEGANVPSNAFDAETQNSVNLAIKKSAEMLSYHSHTKHIDVTSYLMTGEVG